MKKVRPYLDPNELAPEERADRVIELLAEALLRSLRELRRVEEKNGEEGIIKSDSSQETLPGEGFARTKL